MLCLQLRFFATTLLALMPAIPVPQEDEGGDGAQAMPTEDTAAGAGQGTEASDGGAAPMES